MSKIIIIIVKDSCIIIILFLCYIHVQQLLVLVAHLQSSCWCVARACVLYMPHPLIDRAPRNDATFLTTYTAHTDVSDTSIYIYTLNPVESNYRDYPVGHKKSYISDDEQYSYIYIYMYILHGRLTI